MKFSGFAIFSQIQCFLPSNMSHPPVNSRLKRKKIGALRWVPSHSKMDPKAASGRRAQAPCWWTWLGLLTGDWGGFGGWSFSTWPFCNLDLFGMVSFSLRTGWLEDVDRFLLENPSDLVTSWKVGQVTDPTFGDKAEENSGEKSPGLQIF